MQTVKFRGKRFDNGRLVYGDLIQGDNDVVIRDWLGNSFEVDSATVAQYSEARDADGAEAYEGDVLESDYNGKHYEYTVKVKAFAIAKDGCYLTAEQFKNCHLKK